MRSALKARITELWNYPKMSPPYYEGRHWFYSRNSGLQRQSVVFTRETLNGTETVAIDPNALSPDGAIALSGFVPSPDAQHFAYGQSEGGSDWSTYFVRELGTGKQLPDVIRWVKFSSITWTEDGKGFFYGRYPEPRDGQGARRRDQRQEDLLSRARHEPVGGPVDLRAAGRADALHRRRPRRDRPLSVLRDQQGHQQQERAVREGPRRSPRAEARRAGARALSGPHRGLCAARCRERHAVPDDGSRRAESQGGRRADRSRRYRELEDGRAGVEERDREHGDDRRQDRGERACRRRERGHVLQSRRHGGGEDRRRPGSGRSTVRSGRFDRHEVFYTFTSPLYPTTVFRFDLRSGKSTPFQAPKLTFDRRSTPPSACSHGRRTARACRCSSRTSRI